MRRLLTLLLVLMLASACSSTAEEPASGVEEPSNTVPQPEPTAQPAPEN
jgi:hypothetical protein